MSRLFTCLLPLVLLMSALTASETPTSENAKNITWCYNNDPGEKDCCPICGATPAQMKLPQCQTPVPDQQNSCANCAGGNGGGGDGDANPNSNGGGGGMLGGMMPMSGGTYVENGSLNAYHRAIDYQPGMPAGAGCAPCGSGAALGDNPGALPALQSGRTHRYWYLGSEFRQSFGPGVYWTWDTQLLLYGNWSGQRRIRVSDPHTQSLWLFTNDPDLDGVYTGYDRKQVRNITAYDSSNQPIHDFTQAETAVMTRHDGWTMTFDVIRTSADPLSIDRAGRLTSYADRNGNAVTLTYVYAANASDATLGFDRTRLWQVDTVTDAYGRTMEVSYHSTKVGSHWVISALDLPNGSTITYTYGTYTDALGGGATEGLTGIAYPDGTATTIDCVLDGTTSQRVVEIFDAAARGVQRRLELAFHGTGRIRRISNGAGEITYLNWFEKIGTVEWMGIYGGGNRFTRNRFAAGSLRETRAATSGAGLLQPLSGFTYEKVHNATSKDFFNRITGSTDALGRARSQTLADNGKPLSVTHPDGSTESWTYDPISAEPLTHVDRLGRQTVNTYDAQGNLLTRTLAATTAEAGTWTYIRNARGQVTEIRDPNYNALTPDLHSTLYAYDTAGYLVSVTQPADVASGPRWVRTFTWDSAGRLDNTSETVESGGPRVVSYDYDDRDRLTTITYADSSTETWEYATGVDANLVRERKDRNGNITRFTYDAAGRVISTIEAYGQAEAVEEVCTYLPGTVLKATCTKRGNRTEFTYDYANRLIETTVIPRTGDTLVNAVEYDQVGRVRSRTDAYGRKTYFLYDINNRLVRTAHERIPAALSASAPAITVDATVSGSSNASGTSTTWTCARDLWVAGLSRDLSANPDYVLTDTSHDSDGQVLARIDGRGIRATSQYDARGRVIEQIAAEAQIASGGAATPYITPEAARTLIAYDAAGNRTQVTLPRSFTRLGDGTWLNGSDGFFRTTWTYTGRNLTATETVADGLDASSLVRPERATSTWTYTLSGKVATQTDPRTFTTEYRYSICCDRLIEIEDPAGALTTFTYDHYGNRLSMTDGNANTTAWTYDGLHRVVTSTNGAGELTRLAYDDDVAGGLDFPDLAGGIGSYTGLSTYLTGLSTGLDLTGSGASGSAVLQINPEGEFALTIADALGRTVRQVDGNAHASTITYDTIVASLVETAVADALAHTTRTRADGSGLVRVALDAEDAVTTQAFDANGNRVSLRDPVGVGMDCTYDARNREVECEDTRSDVTTVRLTGFDAHGNVVSQTDALSAVETSVYDARDRRISHTDRVAATTDFVYDLSDNLTKITDAEGGETDYVYDSRNLLVEETFPEGSLTNRTVRTYTYDLGRRLTDRVVTTDPASSFSETTEYGYDQANRLLTREYPADGLDDAFQYDQASRLIAAQSDRYRVDVTRAYDAAGRLTSEAQIIRDGSLSGTTVSTATYTVGYQYDDANRTTQITYPDGAVVTRGYTDRNQLETVDHTPVGGSAAAVLVERIYDAAGRLAETEYGNTLVETRSYTPDSHLVAAIEIPSVTDFAYTYDANRRKTQEANGVIAEQTQDFSYDDQDRLTGWERPVVADVQAWTLSLVGDWNSTTRNGVAETRTHTDVHELTSRTIGANPAIALGYDAKGNLSDDGEGRVYVWDPENRLQRATVAGSASPTGLGLVAGYQYDALGRRVAKTVNGRTTRFLSAGAQVVEERDASAVPTQAQVDGADADGTAANEALTPATGGLLQHDPNGDVLRINFQPATAVIPAGYYADTGKVYGVRTNGLSYGWTSAQTGRQQARGYQTLAELDTCARMKPGSGDTPGVWEIALANGAYTVAVVCGDPLSTEQTNNLTIEGQPVTDPDPWATATYTQGDFDAYAVQVVVSDGKLTLAVGAGGIDPKLCLIEISSAWPTSSGTILREWWTGITGTTVSALTSHANYPFAPTGSNEPTLFEAPVNWSNEYGTRMRGYVTAPATGTYTFWIASDDHSELWLSSSRNPTTVTKIASVNGYTASRQWTKYATQTSAGIALVAGESYYIEARHKDGSGGDNLAVGWQLPDITLERPIPGSRLSPWAVSDTATDARLADLVTQATDATYAAAQAATEQRQYVYGTYVDEVLSYTVGSVRYFVHSNHLFSPAAVTDGTGAVVERYAYDAYGTRTVTNAAGTVELATSSVSQSRGFTGYIFDQETGLYHARARQYDSRLGRFISKDPYGEFVQRATGIVKIGYRDGWNLYQAYFAPNELDPSGLVKICCDGTFEKRWVFKGYSDYATCLDRRVRDTNGSLVDEAEAILAALGITVGGNVMKMVPQLKNIGGKTGSAGMLWTLHKTAQFLDAIGSAGEWCSGERCKNVSGDICEVKKQFAVWPFRDKYKVCCYCPSGFTYHDLVYEDGVWWKP